MVLRYWAQALSAALAFSIASSVNAQSFPVRNETGVSAWPFNLEDISLTSGRFADNQGRTLIYLKWVDTERLLYVFRANHKLSTNGASANGGWDAPSFPFRSHV
jgi:hypothetical protein